jgi:Protein of unknown function (DUF1402)
MNTVVALVAILFSSGPSHAADEYEELCKYDDFCKMLKNGSDYVAPNTETVKQLSEHRADILAAAKQLGVDPRAVAGSILADFTLTGSRPNPLATGIFAKIFGSGTKSFDGRYIHEGTLRNAEAFAAGMEGRPIKTGDELKKEMQTPKGVIYYTAAIIRQGQDAYGKKGFDISKNPGILATLYNLGKPEERADRLAAENPKRDPRRNFFGFFIDHSEPDRGA